LSFRPVQATKDVETKLRICASSILAEKEKAMEFLGFIGLFLVALVVIVIGVYNNLVAKRQNARQGFADIDTALRQRADLIPNLVETVKGYATHEAGTLNAVIAARAGALDARSPEQMASANKALSGALGNLLAVAENYPDLKASANFQTLQHELADVEDKLSASRRAYNSAVGDYNTAAQSFPAVLFAGALGFANQDFWEVDADQRGSLQSAPNVSFGR
jgi:LemA protein